MGHIQDLLAIIRGKPDHLVVRALDELLPRWIPVTERLPDISERVLVFCPLLDPDEIVGSTLAANGIWQCDDGQILGETEPTHWMPLPEPPRG